MEKDLKVKNEGNLGEKKRQVEENHLHHNGGVIRGTCQNNRAAWEQMLRYLLGRTRKT